MNGVRYEFAPKTFETIAFAPEKDMPGTYFAILKGDGKVLLPVPFTSGKKPNIRTPDNKKIPYLIINGQLELNVTDAISGKRIGIKF